MKTRKLDTLKITVTPGQSTHTALYGATSRDGEKYNHGACIDDEYIWSNGVRIRDFADMLNTPGDYWPFFVPIAESRAVRIFSTRSAASIKKIYWSW